MTEPTQGLPEAKKGLSPLAWVLITLGGLVVAGVLVVTVLFAFVFRAARDVVGDFADNPARAAAELIVRANPELDLVETDDRAGTITVRNEKTGETVTLNFEDIAEGKWSASTEEGDFTFDATEAADGGGVTISGPEGEFRFGASADLGDVPDWVPLYPDVTETQGTVITETEDGLFGIISQQTDHGAQKVMDHYQTWLESEGYEITARSTTTTSDGTLASIMAERTDQGRTITVNAIEQPGETQVTVNYNEKKN